MFDPFKTTRARSRKKLRSAKVPSVSNAWGTLLTPAKPARRAKASAGERKAKRVGPVAKQAPPATSRSTGTVPRGASFRTGTHEGAFGARSYKLYVPSMAKKAEEPLPLIVMLHGCGQTPQDFARGTGMNALAEEFGALVLYPAQARKAHLNRCWNWFKRSDQARGGGEPALIAGLTQEIIAGQPVDPARVYVAGLSAGASASLIVATAYSDIFAAVGVHSGLAVGAAHDAASATRAMVAGAPGRRLGAPMPTIIFHGEKDKVVNPRNGRFAAMRALQPYDRLERTEKTMRVSGGHEYVRTAHRVGRGRSYVEHWLVQGSGHAWSGGNASGSYTDPDGPDASREMMRFFLRHRTTKKRRASPGSPGVTATL
ncbi:MAG: PHB depolymerase family esterase [Phycisphaerales bacterium]|jgi:poly(hydroxyalkanoate) depolymerase family esterase|nr:PHB depolymerase family esterase [Roseibium sp.]